MKNVVKDMKLSEGTAKLQKKFLNTIYIQIAVPFFVIFIPSVISVFSGFLEISTQSISNLVYVMFSIHGLISTLIMLSIRKPYREFRFRNSFVPVFGHQEFKFFIPLLI